MSEQNTNAQLEAYRKLVEDFKRFVSSEIRTEENSYRIVDMTSEDAEINDPSVPVTQLEDDKAEKLAGICMDLSNATLWLYYNRDKFANVEFMPLTDETLKEYQKQAQNALNEPKSPLYLKSWYQLIEMLSQECIPQRYEDDGVGVKIMELDGSYQMCTKGEMYSRMAAPLRALQTGREAML